MAVVVVLTTAKISKSETKFFYQLGSNIQTNVNYEPTVIITHLINA
jgi:hypothetical protein